MVDGGQLVALLVVDGGRDLLGVGLHTVQYSTGQYSTAQVNSSLHYRQWRFRL